MRLPVLFLCALVALPPVASAASGKKGRKAKPAPAPQEQPAEDIPSVPPELQQPEQDANDMGKPQAPEAQKQEGLSGQTAGEGLTCPEGQVPVRKGVVLRAGPAINFGLVEVSSEDHCFPRIRDGGTDGSWIMVEIAQGQAGWFQHTTPPLASADPPPLPRAPPAFEVTLTEDVIFHLEPSLLSAITGQGFRDEVLQVHAVSEDGLLFLVGRDGASAGWVLKTMTRDTLDLEGAPGGGKPWAPAPKPLTRLPAGSPDAIFREPANGVAPAPTPAPAAAAVGPDGKPLPNQGAQAAPAAPAAPEVPEDEDPNESLYARGEVPQPKPLDWKALIGIRPLNNRPMGRGLSVGVGLAPVFFLQRFQSNAFNDPLGNYRVDSGTLGLALDVEYHAGLGLMLGMRLQAHGFAYTDYIPPQLRNAPEPIGNPNRPADLQLPGCPYPAPAGVARAICPIPSTIQMAQFYGGWRLYGSDSLDVGLRLAYVSDLLLFGKPSTREPFSDLWYHGVRPSASLLFRPFGGKFGAAKGEMGMGAGVVVPMVLRPSNACAGGNAAACVPQPRNTLESTYTYNEDTQRMRRSGYARPPFYAGLDLRAGYLFEVPFVQMEAAMQCMARYYAVFYTAQEGFSKRNRCCDRGYYDRATNLDFYAGPVLMGRFSL